MTVEASASLASVYDASHLAAMGTNKWPSWLSSIVNQVCYSNIFKVSSGSLVKSCILSIGRSSIVSLWNHQPGTHSHTPTQLFVPAKIHTSNCHTMTVFISLVCLFNCSNSVHTSCCYV